MSNPDLQTMIHYEQGELAPEQVQEFFQSLLDSGLIFHLQGSYQRTASGLLDAGVITFGELPPKAEKHE